MNKKIYISAPISGYDIEERREMFQRVKNILRGYGYIVLNPMENGIPPESDTRQHMKADIKMMLEADEVLFLDKWLHSAGCHTEFMVATAVGMTIKFGNINSVRLSISQVTFD